MTSTNTRITTVLNHLRDALGTGETPPGSNHNFITEWYNKNVSNIGDGPWCEMTNTWAMWISGFKSLKKGRAYTPWACEDALAGVNGSSWHWDTVGMRAGDEVYYDWSGRKGKDAIRYVDHTGTVEKIFGDGTFYVLEGNVGNKMVRMRRDSRHVVGYVRFAWDRIPGEPPAPVPPKKPVVHSPNRGLIQHIQTALEVSSDGIWGPITDERARRMRNASRSKVGGNWTVKVGFDVEDVQKVIDTTVDGDWGPRSQAMLHAWVHNFQNVLGVNADGIWGPVTDNAFLVARKKNHH